VKTIKDWPLDPADGLAEQVPTETWYSTVPMFRPPARNQLDNYDLSTKKRKRRTSTPSRDTPESQEKEGDEFGDSEMVGLDTDDSTEFLWGYAVPLQRYSENSTRDDMRRIDRAKLMLIDTPYTQKGRDSLKNKIKFLRNKGLIRKYGDMFKDDVRDVRDVITDFLVKVLEHVKGQLVVFEKFTDNWKVEIVITVPTAWSSNSSRILGSCMEAAMAATRFGSLKNGAIDNLFIIPEPEAAATWMLGNDHEVVVRLYLVPSA